MTRAREYNEVRRRRSEEAIVENLRRYNELMVQHSVLEGELDGIEEEERCMQVVEARVESWKCRR